MENHLAEVAMFLDGVAAWLEPYMSLQWLQDGGDKIGEWCVSLGGTWGEAKGTIGGTHECYLNPIGDGAVDYFERNTAEGRGL